MSHGQSSSKTVQFIVPRENSLSQAGKADPDVYYQEEVVLRMSQRFSPQPRVEHYYFDEDDDNDSEGDDNIACTEDEKRTGHCVSGLGPTARRFQCPLCGKQTFTIVEEISSFKTHCMAAILCLACCCFVSLTPYTSRRYHNVKHYCSRCDYFLGTYINPTPLCPLLNKKRSRRRTG